MIVSSPGNPYHDEEGKFCSGPDVSGVRIVQKSDEEYEKQTKERKKEEEREKKRVDDALLELGFAETEETGHMPVDSLFKDAIETQISKEPPKEDTTNEETESKNQKFPIVYRNDNGDMIQVLSKGEVKIDTASADGSGRYDYFRFNTVGDAVDYLRERKFEEVLKSDSLDYCPVCNHIMYGGRCPSCGYPRRKKGLNSQTVKRNSTLVGGRFVDSGGRAVCDGVQVSSWVHPWGHEIVMPTDGSSDSRVLLITRKGKKYTCRNAQEAVYIAETGRCPRCYRRLWGRRKCRKCKFPKRDRRPDWGYESFHKDYVRFENFSEDGIFTFRNIDGSSIRWDAKHGTYPDGILPKPKAHRRKSADTLFKAYRNGYELSKTDMFTILDDSGLKAIDDRTEGDNVKYIIQDRNKKKYPVLYKNGKFVLEKDRNVDFLEMIWSR